MYIDGFTRVVVSVCGRGAAGPGPRGRGRPFFTALDVRKSRNGPELFRALDPDDADKVRLFETGLRDDDERRALPDLFRAVAAWVRSRSAGAFDTWRGSGGEAYILIELTVGDDEWGGTAHELDLPADFLAACAEAKLPVRLDPGG